MHQVNGMTKSKKKKSKKRAKPKKEIPNPNEFKSSDGSINLEAIIKVEKLARNGEDISDSLDSLKDLILVKEKKIYSRVANALTFFYDNFISYIWYSFKYHDYFQSIDFLNHQDVKKRKEAIEYLEQHRHRKPGREWKYLDDAEIASLKEKLNSPNKKIRKDIFQLLPEKVKNGLNIYCIITELRNALMDNLDEIRWGAALALTHYYAFFPCQTDLLVYIAY